MARKAYAVARYVRKSIENKYITSTDEQITNIQNPTSGTNGNYREIINLCTQGDEQDDRQGNKIYMKWFSLKGRLIANTNASAQIVQRVRIMLVMDKQPQSSGGTAPTYGDILQATGAVNYITALYDRSQFLNNRRYKVLYDRVHAVAGDRSGSSGGNPQGSINTDKLIRIYCPIKKQITFNANDTTVALGRNWIYLYVFSDCADTYGPTLDYDWRSSFIDN